MPLVSVLLPGKQGYLDWKWVIDGKEIPYGLFLGEVVNFLIVALALFLFIVKFLGWVMRTKKEEKADSASADQGPGAADRDPRSPEREGRLSTCTGESLGSESHPDGHQAAPGPDADLGQLDRAGGAVESVGAWRVVVSLSLTSG